MTRGTRLPWIVLALIGAAAFCFSLTGCLPPLDPQQSSTSSDPTTSSTGGGGGTTTSSSSDDAVQHCVTTINKYRSQAGAPPIQLSPALSIFSKAASEALASGGAPHQYFIDASNNGMIFSSGFCNGAAENQAPGWQADDNLNDTVDAVLEAMMSEGQGGGHHDNIVSASNGLVGVGLVVKDGALYFTNDFSPPCR